MKTTTDDKIAFAFALAIGLLPVGAWFYAAAAERDAQRLMQTTYSQSTPQFDAAFAAGEADDEDALHLAQGR